MTSPPQADSRAHKAAAFRSSSGTAAFAVHSPVVITVPPPSGKSRQRLHCPQRYVGDGRQNHTAIGGFANPQRARLDDSAFFQSGVIYKIKIQLILQQRFAQPDESLIQPIHSGMR